MKSKENAKFLTLSGIGKSFNGHTAVQDIDLTISRGESVCFLGPSGCGKTTLLRLISGLETPDIGSITLDGQDITHTPPTSRNFGMVFQSYSLFPHLSVGKNVAFGLNCRKWKKEKMRTRVQEMLDLVHLADQINKLPHQLSGGQQQRIAIARALAAQPYVLLLDEPFSALDAKVRGQLRSDMRDLQKRLGITTILVTHDQEEAMEVADRIVVMKDGKIEQIGNGPEIYHQPKSPFVANFVGEMNVLRVQRSTEGDLVFAGKKLSVSEPLSDNCKQVGIRPEAITLATSNEGENCFAGTVIKTQFMGKQTRTEVALDNQVICLALYGRQDNAIKAGSPVCLYLSPTEIRQLDEH